MQLLASVSLALAALTAGANALPHPSYDNSTAGLARRGVAGYGTTQKVRGVNLGGWFVLEAWMTPSLFTSDLVAKGAIDQFTYMQAWNDNTKAQAALEQHWATWITAADFAQIAAAGLNTVRIPINHWMFGVAPNTAGAASEPYLTNGAELPYVDQALRWALQYGLQVQLDMHTAPNSQNGFDNSGRQGGINFAATTPDDNIARLEYALVSAVKRWVVDSSFGGVVTSVEALNEPAIWWTPSMTKDFMVGVHKRVYNSMQTAMANVATKPTIVFHDGFMQPLTTNWDNVYTDLAAGTYAMDIHRYQAWAPQNTYSFDKHISYTCGMASELATSNARRPVVMGEWSLAIGCTNCSYATMADNVNSQNNATQNRFFRRFYEAQVATYERAGGWIFWNWKTASRADWSFKDAIAQGWIPSNVNERVFQTDSSGCPTDTLVAGKTLTFATESTPSPQPSPTSSTPPPVQTPVVVPVSAPNSAYRISWAIDGKRSSYGSSSGYIKRSTVGNTWLGQSQAVACANQCEATKGCAMGELIRFDGGKEGQAVCALYKSYQQKASVTYTAGPGSSGGRVVTSYAIRRNAGPVKRKRRRDDGAEDDDDEEPESDVSPRGVDDLFPLIRATGKRINQNAHPVIKKTTFNFGPVSH